ncbi:hypothetical protein T484DRAFT_1889859 [Baffinella frigidus]|nr:hypothetical protein T484DRAFT_1889859 [Cryptophyta sp. CCMP2293]
MEEVADVGDQIRVAVRVRPFNSREAARNCKCCVEMDGGTTILRNDDAARGPDDGKRVFNFDHCYWSHDRSHPNYASQEAVFNDLGRLALRNAFLGYNVCLFAYGQTGSGKSFSMVGNEDDRGIVPRVATELFEKMEAQKQENVAFEVVTSMIEIYSEKIRDLLNPRAGKTELRVREHPKKGPYIEGLTAMPALSYKEIERQIEVGNRSRSVASTHMNDVSSRAHTIFSIKFSQTSLEKLESGLARETKKVSIINLVDLAGSERQSSKQLTATEQARFKEGVAINKSLSALANCIFALYKQSQQKAGEKIHIPYRDSQLTWLLKESLGGNAKTIMIAAISPADINFEESLSTLQYAARAKRIKTNAKVNEDTNDKIIRELRAEIERLRREVAEQKPADAESDADREVQELRQQLLESQKMIEQMNQHWQEQLKENAEKQRKDTSRVSVSGKGVYIDDQNTPQLINLNEDPLMTECLVYFLASGTTVMGSSVDEQDSDDGSNGIPLVGQTIAPLHCSIKNVNGQVTIEAIEGAVTFVNGRRITEVTPLKQGHRIVLGTSHMFRFHDPVESARLRLEREEYLLVHPTETLTNSAVFDWNYAKEELRLMNGGANASDWGGSSPTGRPTSPQGFSEHNGGSFSENNGSSTGSPVSRDGGASSGGGAHVKGDDTFELLHERRLSPRTLARSDSDDRMLEAGNSGKFPINPLPDDHHVVLPDMSSAASDASGLDTASQFSAAAPVRPPDPPKPATPAGPAAAMAGIGVLVQRLGGMITVVDLVKGGPADMSRELKIGQVVLEVDGQSVDQTSFRNVLQLIRGPVGSWISLMVQDIAFEGAQRGVNVIKMQRGLLPSENHTAADRRESTGSKGSKDRSRRNSRGSPPSQNGRGWEAQGGSDEEAELEDEDEDEDDEAMDLSMMPLEELTLNGSGNKGPTGISSELVKAGKGNGAQSLENDFDEENDEDEDSGSESDSSMLNLEEVASGSEGSDEPEDLGALEASSDSGSAENLEDMDSDLEPLDGLDSPPTSPQPPPGGGKAAAPRAGHATNNTHHPHQQHGDHTAPSSHAHAAVKPAAPAGGTSRAAHPHNHHNNNNQPPAPAAPAKPAPLCIKIDVEPTNRAMPGYSLMFNVEQVAIGLRYGVEVKDHKTMLKVYARCFTARDAKEWLAAHALKAFMAKENQGGSWPSERLRILSRSAALLLAQRLMETEVFRLVSKPKQQTNPFETPTNLFRFREDEDQGSVLNTRHVWNRRARPPAVVAADLLHKAAEELQMVDPSLLFRRAEVAFFLNLHNALMLHSHIHRGSLDGENLRALRTKFYQMHQYRVGGQVYHMEAMRSRLFRAKPGSRLSGGAAASGEARFHFALSFGCASSPDVKVFSVDGLDQELTDAVSAMLKRDVQIVSGGGQDKTVILPKVFKWHSKDFGDDKGVMLNFVAEYVPAPLSTELRTIALTVVTKNIKIKFVEFDWRKRSYGKPP